ncbi:MAG: CDP-alcohol phosphatidyltransferase family protein [Bacteroidota bacterium]
MKQIPNILTLANLFTGMIMIPYIIMGEVDIVLILLGIALILDFLDGFLARLLDASSELGKNLDSLADMVSFGVSSGLILAHLIAKSMGVAFPSNGFEQPLWMVGLLVPVFAAIRLAKYNIQQEEQHFSGVPTPANAMLVFSLWFLYEKGYAQGDSIWNSISEGGWLPFFWLVLSLVSCVLMVLPVRLMALKFKGFSWGENRFRYVLIVLSGIVLIIFQSLALPFIFLLYLGVSFVNNLQTSKEGSK